MKLARVVLSSSLLAGFGAVGCGGAVSTPDGAGTARCTENRCRTQDAADAASGGAPGFSAAGGSLGAEDAASFPPQGTGGVSIVPIDAARDASRACAAIVTAADDVPFDAYLMVDRASERGLDGGGSLQTTDAIVGLVKSMKPFGNVGIQYFPLPPAPGACDASYEIPAVELAPLAENASAILASLRTRGPAAAGRPTGPALAGAIRHMKAWGAAHPDARLGVVLVTDGAPDECDPLQTKDLKAVAAAGAESLPSVLTFVVVLGAPLDALDAVAVAGRTERAHVLRGPDPGADLTMLLRDITFGIPSCDFKLPAFLPSGFDLGLTEVKYRAFGGTADIQVERVAGGADCAAHQDLGWYPDREMQPTALFLCPATCADLSGGRIEVTLGCR